jgi:hypothetical protein
MATLAGTLENPSFPCIYLNDWHLLYILATPLHCEPLVKLAVRDDELPSRQTVLHLTRQCI